MCIRDSGYSADEIFSSAFYNTRPELFFDFYKKEMLLHAPKPTKSGPALAALELSLIHISSASSWGSSPT